jgi:hypothetical protein
MIVRLAAAALPEDMPPFLKRELQRLEFLSFEPDEWRDPVEERLSPALRRGHDPDHHFRLELFAAPELPPDRYSFLKALEREGKDFSDAGVLPYRATELFQRMRVAFRRWRSTRDKATLGFLETRIVDDAGILAHYVGDASQPLHTTVNTNGWALPENPRNFTRDNTLHGRFEADFIHARVHDDDVTPLLRNVEKVDRGLEYVHAEIRRAHDRVIPLYDLERESRFDAANDSLKAKAFAAERLADGASTLRDLWYEAWRSSAQPR